MDATIRKFRHVLAIADYNSVTCWHDVFYSKMSEDAFTFLVRLNRKQLIERNLISDYYTQR